jgi:GNAT superfamily N-acetyltransferase
VSRTIAAPPRPLAESDDRERFDCGRESMNAWFRRHAWFNQANNLSRITVITDPANGRIIGYVSLSAAQIERAYLPKPQQRNRPDPVPALLLGQLAVDKGYHGQGHAGDLMQYALKAALHVSEVIGCMGVIAHPLDDAVREFYRQFGFEDLPFDPRRAMIVRMVDLKRQFGEEE